jgi:5,6-dimethylbenzimidazole synthase
VYRAILTRRDVRGQFRPDPVPDAVLSRVLIAAHHAPSVGFMQPWSFLVLRDVAVRRRVHDLFVKANAEAVAMFPAEKQDLYRSLKLEGIMEAPINLCVTCDPDRAGPVVIGRTHIKVMDTYSAVCAVQNLWLAARAEGLGVGWVSILDQEMLRQTLGIPERIVPVAYLCVGWVEGYHRQPELELAGWRRRLPVEEVLYVDRWGASEGAETLLDRVRGDAQAVVEGRFLAERLEP